MRFLAALVLGLIIVAGCTPAPEPEPEGINIDINVPGVEGEIRVPRKVDVDVRRGRVDVNDTHINWKEDKK